MIPASGTVRPREQVRVSPPSGARISQVLVQPNQRVRKGDVLATADLEYQKHQVEQAAALLVAAQRDVEVAEVQERQASIEYAAKQHLHELGFISLAGTDVTKAAFEERQLSVQKGKAARDAARAKLAVETTVLKNGTLRSPIDGIVLLVDVHLGEGSVEGKEPPGIVVASDLATVFVDAAVSERDIQRVSKSSTVQFVNDNGQLNAVSGVVSSVFLSPNKERATVTYSVRILADNPAKELLPGMNVDVQFDNRKASHVLKIPLKALYYKPQRYEPTLSREEKEYFKAHGLPTTANFLNGFEMGTIFAARGQRVFVYENNHIEPRRITIGAQDDDSIEVKSGLSLGTKVVIDDREKSPL